MDSGVLHTSIGHHQERLLAINFGIKIGHLANLSDWEPTRDWLFYTPTSFTDIWCRQFIVHLATRYCTGRRKGGNHSGVDVLADSLSGATFVLWDLVRVP